MAGTIGRTGRTAILAAAIAASLGAATQASAQEMLRFDPYIQGRCPGAEGYEPGFHINFNPQVRAWPVYEPTECGPPDPGEPPPEPRPERRRSTSPSPATQPTQPSTPARRKAKRARCAKRHARAGWRCARKTRPA